MAMKSRTLTLIAAAISALTACSGATLLNAVVPSGGYRLRPDVAYGPDPDQHLDVYVPRAPWTGGGPRPTVMFIHGGSWESGDKGMYKFVAEAMTSRGWVAVVPDYRKYPRVRWPSFMDDAADAFSWVSEHAAEWGGDSRHIIAMGHSAGAHMAALLAMDPRYLARSPHPASVAAVVGLSGPYDFLPITGPDIQDIFSTAGDLQLTQPIHFARAGLPPMLLLHGEADDTVWPKNTRNLAASLRESGSPVEEHIYPGVDHVRMVVSLAGPFRFRYRTLDDIARFVAGALRTDGARTASTQPDSGGPALQGSR